MTYTETHLVDAIENLAAEEIGALTQPQLDGIDQFHAGGAEAVDRIVPTLRLGPVMTALDVGSGLGGPARQVARSTGCSVLGVDITRPYVETAAALTRQAGLDDRVTFLCTDVSELDRNDFDAAYTIHVQMNVADKSTFFTDIASRLREGARLAVFEVCRTGHRDPDLPLPWSIDGSDSHLATPAGLLASVEASGFQPLEWVDETEWVMEWFRDLGTRLAHDGTAATLPALLEDGATRMLNFVAGLDAGVLSVHRGAFARR
jgi:ubiquinone/menaquinone biosynthesis C-methylase UbiE